jgi:hypothetical protein
MKISGIGVKGSISMEEKCNLENAIGPVSWDTLRQDLLSFSKETLAEMVNIWLKNYWTNQNYWMVYTEEGFGFDAACKMDEKVWGKTGPV